MDDMKQVILKTEKILRATVKNFTAFMIEIVQSWFGVLFRRGQF